MRLYAKPCVQELEATRERHRFLIRGGAIIPLTRRLLLSHWYPSVMATFVGVGWRTCKPGSGTGMEMRSAMAANVWHVVAFVRL